jgi:hypothetical protein
VTFTAITFSHSSRPIQRRLRTLLECPALLIRTSTWPNCASVHWASSWASAGRDTSPGCATAWPPAPVISATTSSSGGLRRPLITTRAPSFASMRAVQRPMPLPPPVTMATVPSRRAMARS